jgi:hypothetical protein
VRVPINTFLKSNPNKVFTSAIDVPKADEPTTVRPSVPEEMQEIIAEETSPEEVTPEKTKSLFEKLFGKD